MFDSSSELMTQIADAMRDNDVFVPNNTLRSAFRDKLLKTLSSRPGDVPDDVLTQRIDLMCLKMKVSLSQEAISDDNLGSLHDMVDAIVVGSTASLDDFLGNDGYVNPHYLDSLDVVLQQMSFEF